MGFKGHFAPGMYMILTALWHLQNGLKRYYQCKRNGTLGKLRLTASYPGVPFLGKRYSRIHAEGLILLVAGALDAIAEFIIGIGPRNHTEYWIMPSSSQHVVMLTLMCVRSIISLICYYTKWLPHEADYLTTGLLPILLIPLFVFHIHGKATSDALVHVTMGLFLYLMGSFTLYEMKHRNSIMALIGKAFISILMGVWFIHAAGVLLVFEPLLTNHVSMDVSSQIVYLSLYFILDALCIAAVFMYITARVEKHVMTEYPTKKYLKNVF
ncbi:unnamed protein product [Cyprideis torosa]|uniref:Uncharacterized protein n=1 Tax=Cyprideis torosa TaxID=163714 RepID=A0A7R8WGG9_9CRUS|nr:unnamed protein product [Cyprideis torosa]CAG0898149.1 unnamed protein product [Cyprideis torosa]